MSQAETSKKCVLVNFTNLGKTCFWIPKEEWENALLQLSMRQDVGVIVKSVSNTFAPFQQAAYDFFRSGYIQKAARFDTAFSRHILCPLPLHAKLRQMIYELPSTKENDFITLIL